MYISFYFVFKLINLCDRNTYFIELFLSCFALNNYNTLNNPLSVFDLIQTLSELIDSKTGMQSKSKTLLHVHKTHFVGVSQQKSPILY